MRDVEGFISQRTFDELEKSLSHAEEFLKSRSDEVRKAEQAVWDLWDRRGVIFMRTFEMEANKKLNMVEDLPKVCLIFDSIDSRENIN